MCRGWPPGVSSASTLGGRALTRLNPPFVSSRGGGGGGRESGPGSRRPHVARDGLGGVRGGDPRRQRTLRERARRLRLGSASRAPARRAASPVAAAAAGALRGSSSPSPGVGSVRGRGGREGEIGAALVVSKSRGGAGPRREVAPGFARLAGLPGGALRCVGGVCEGTCFARSLIYCF